MEDKHLLQPGAHATLLHHNALAGVVLVVADIGDDARGDLWTEACPLVRIDSSLDDTEFVLGIVDAHMQLGSQRLRLKSAVGGEFGIESIEVGEDVLAEHTVVQARQVPLAIEPLKGCLLYTSPSPRDGLLSRMPSSA